VAYLKQVLLDTCCPLQQHSNPMQTAAGVWPDCRLETNPFCWARQSAAVRRQHFIRIGFIVAADLKQ